MKTATARARSNIALVKYWGKLEKSSNLPAVGSISITLNSFYTTTTVRFDDKLTRDEFILNGDRAPKIMYRRTSSFLDVVRKSTKVDLFAYVKSENNFPTAAGLASSASGFAALAAAAVRATGIKIKMSELAGIARIGSGSAPRSLMGGFVEMACGTSPQIKTQPVTQIAPPNYWDLRLVVAITAQGPKKIGSTEGMERSKETSPFYAEWVDSHPQALDQARKAIIEKDFHALGRITEASCFQMHAVILSSEPPMLYWNPTTVATIHRVWQLRKEGLAGYVTIDAGPHVKILCLADDASEIEAELKKIAGVKRVVVEKPGPGVEYF